MEEKSISTKKAVILVIVFSAISCLITVIITSAIFIHQNKIEEAERFRVETENKLVQAWQDGRLELNTEKGGFFYRNELGEVPASYLLNISINDIENPDGDYFKKCNEIMPYGQYCFIYFDVQNEDENFTQEVMNRVDESFNYWLTTS